MGTITVRSEHKILILSMVTIFTKELMVLIRLIKGIQMNKSLQKIIKSIAIMKIKVHILIMEIKGLLIQKIKILILELNMTAKLKYGMEHIKTI